MHKHKNKSNQQNHNPPISQKKIAKSPKSTQKLYPKIKHQLTQKNKPNKPTKQQSFTKKKPKNTKTNAKQKNESSNNHTGN